MRHDHPRGDPIGGLSGSLFCPACVSQGITTFDELTRPETPWRGKIKAGMTVSFRWQVTNPDDAYNMLLERKTGQVWSQAETPRGLLSCGIICWWVVDKDGQAYKVRQDYMSILSKGQADVCLVS